MEVIGINAGTQAEAHTELKPGLVLLSVGGTSVVGMPYKQVIETIKGAGRPLTCEFSAGSGGSTAKSPAAGTHGSPNAAVAGSGSSSFSKPTSSVTTIDGYFEATFVDVAPLGITWLNPGGVGRAPRGGVAAILRAGS